MKSFWFFGLLLVFIIIIGAYLFLDYFLFRHQGARFTANDGQELCLRVQALDKLPCEYVNK